MEDERAVGSYKPKTEMSFETSSYNREEYERTSSLDVISGYETNKLLADYQNNFKSIVKLANYHSDKVGFVKSAVRVYITFTVGDIRLDSGLKKNRDFLEKFIKDTKLNKIVRQSTPDLYKAGNFFWFREKDERGKTVWIHQLSPLDVEVKGHKMARPIATVNLHTNDEETVPKGLVKASISGEYKLPIEQTYHCAIDREGYSRYGKSVVTPAFEPIQHIEELMDMEKQTMKEVVEFLIIFTLGDKDRPAGETALTKLGETVKNLKNTSRLVGNHTLKADAIRPEIAVFNPEKYEVPMKMLMQSLGITPSIFTGEGSYASASAGMTSAKQTMENARQEIVDTLEQLFYDIAKEAGLNPDKNPKVSLGKLNLNDEKIQHAILRDLYLDGVISAETYAEQHGYTLENEMEEVENEKKYKIEPRPMSSTMSFGNEGRPSDSPQGSNTPNNDKKPSTDN